MAYVVCDLETTGLNVKEAAIVEIGAIKIDRAGRRHEFSKLLKARVPIEDSASKIHGIQQAEADSNGGDPATVLKEFLAFVEDLPLVAHNGLRFDFPFLYNELIRYSLKVGANHLIDTKILAQSRLGVLRSESSLASLCQSYHIKNVDAHRALSDAKAALKLFEITRARVKNLVDLWIDSGSSEWNYRSSLPLNFELVTEAVVAKATIELEYHSEDQTVERLLITPLRVFQREGGHLCVNAYCHAGAIEKEFRVDQILRVMKIAAEPT